MKVLTYLLVIIVLYAFGCKENQDVRTKVKPEGSNTQIFAEYLNEELELNIPSDSHYFLIVLKDGCHGVIESALMNIDKKIGSKNNISIITSNKLLANKYFKNSEVQMHYNYAIDVINLPLFNVSLIKTDNGQINYILSERDCSKNIGEMILDSLNTSSH